MFQNMTDTSLRDHITLDGSLLTGASFRVLTVQAHADDETITMGGTMARCHDAGIATTVVCCTDGSKATIFDPAMDEEATRPRLAAIRQEELISACTILGVSSIHWLNYGDSNMAGHEDNHREGAFWSVKLDEAVEKLVAILRAVRPHIVVCNNSYGAYGHPDHIQSHRVTVLAVEAARHPLMYPDAGHAWSVGHLLYTAMPKSAITRMSRAAAELGIDMPFWRDDAALLLMADDDEVTDMIDIQPVIRRKHDALLAHRSQIQPDWPMVALLDGPLAEHAAHEAFTRVTSYPSSAPAPTLSELMQHHGAPA